MTGLSGAPTGLPSSSGKFPRPLERTELASLATAASSPLSSIIKNLEDSVSAGSTVEFDAFVQAGWLLDRVTGPKGAFEEIVSDEVRAAFRSGTLESWKTRSMASEYAGQHFRFLRVIARQGRAGLLFRSVGDKGQLGFSLLTVAQGADGTLGADDVMALGTGEFATDTLRRNYLTLVASLDPQGEIGHRATIYIDHLPQVLEFNHTMGRREYQAALALHESLPAVVRQDRSMLLGRLEAAERVSVEEYAAAFAEWQRLHPDPMSLPLKSADFFLTTGRYVDAESVLRQLDAAVGGDPYLKQRLGSLRRTQRHLGLQQTPPEPEAPHETTAAEKSTKQGD